MESNQHLQNIQIHLKDNGNQNLSNQEVTNLNNNLANPGSSAINKFNLPANNLVNTNITNGSEIEGKSPEIQPTYTSQLQTMSTLPSVESVTAAISSVGANFNEDAVFAELTSQEDNRGYVRRPMNAFMVWSKQARRRIALAYPNLLNCEISKLLGREWGRMSSKEKEPYVALSTKLRENHNLLHPDYTYKPRKRRRKGESKNFDDFYPAIDPNLTNYSKSFPIQNPMMGNSMGGIYNAGVQRYLNPNYQQLNSFANYPSQSIKTYSQNNSSVNSGGNNLPPLNYQNGYLMACPQNKLNTSYLNINPNQFFPANGTFFPQMNAQPSIHNYYQGYDSNKINSFTNIYGNEEEMPSNPNIDANNSSIMPIHSQNIGDMQNYSQNTIYNKNINPQGQYLYGPQTGASGNQIDSISKNHSHDSNSNYDPTQDSSKQHTPNKSQ